MVKSTWSTLFFAILGSTRLLQYKSYQQKRDSWTIETNRPYRKKFLFYPQKRSLVGLVNDYVYFLFLFINDMTHFPVLIFFYLLPFSCHCVNGDICLVLFKITSLRRKGLFIRPRLYLQTTGAIWKPSGAKLEIKHTNSVVLVAP